MTVVKICGVTRLEDALAAAQFGADMLGINLYAGSPRSLEPARAEELVLALRTALRERCPLLVGVFVNEEADTTASLVELVGLDLAQLSGDEPIETLKTLAPIAVKAIRPQSVEEAVSMAKNVLPTAPDDPRLPSLVLDAYHPTLYGGTGEQTSLDVIRAVLGIAPRLMLAGGLTPQNVGGRIAAAAPWGVDVASGVEAGTPGIKDHTLMRAFIEAVHTADHTARS